MTSTSLLKMILPGKSNKHIQCSRANLISKILLKFRASTRIPRLYRDFYIVFHYRLTQWTIRNIGRIEKGRKGKKEGEGKRSALSPLYSHNVDLSRFSLGGISDTLLIRGEAYERPPVISHIALCSRGAGIRSIGSMCLMPSGSASDAPDTVLVKSACPCR